MDQAAYQAARPYLSRFALDKAGAILVPVGLALYAPYRGVCFGMTWPEAAKSMVHVFPGITMRSRPLPEEAPVSIQQPTSEDIPFIIPVEGPVEAVTGNPGQLSQWDWAFVALVLFLIFTPVLAYIFNSWASRCLSTMQKQCGGFFNVLVRTTSLWLSSMLLLALWTAYTSTTTIDGCPNHGVLVYPLLVILLVILWTLLRDRTMATHGRFCRVIFWLLIMVLLLLAVQDNHVAERLQTYRPGYEVSFYLALLILFTIFVSMRVRSLKPSDRNRWIVEFGTILALTILVLLALWALKNQQVMMCCEDICDTTVPLVMLLLLLALWTISKFRVYAFRRYGKITDWIILALLLLLITWIAAKAWRAMYAWSLCRLLNFILPWLFLVACLAVRKLAMPGANRRIWLIILCVVLVAMSILTRWVLWLLSHWYLCCNTCNLTIYLILALILLLSWLIRSLHLIDHRSRIDTAILYVIPAAVLLRLFFAMKFAWFGFCCFDKCDDYNYWLLILLLIGIWTIDQIYSRAARLGRWRTIWVLVSIVAVSLIWSMMKVKTNDSNHRSILALLVLGLWATSKLYAWVPRRHLARIIRYTLLFLILLLVLWWIVNTELQLIDCCLWNQMFHVVLAGVGVFAPWFTQEARFQNEYRRPLGGVVPIRLLPVGSITMPSRNFSIELRMWIQIQFRLARDLLPVGLITMLLRNFLIEVRTWIQIHFRMARDFAIRIIVLREPLLIRPIEPPSQHAILPQPVHERSAAAIESSEVRRLWPVIRFWLVLLQLSNQKSRVEISHLQGVINFTTSQTAAEIGRLTQDYQNLVGSARDILDPTGIYLCLPDLIEIFRRIKKRLEKQKARILQLESDIENSAASKAAEMAKVNMERKLKNLEDGSFKKTLQMQQTLRNKNFEFEKLTSSKANTEAQNLEIKKLRSSNKTLEDTLAGQERAIKELRHAKEEASITCKAEKDRLSKELAISEAARKKADDKAKDVERALKTAGTKIAKLEGDITAAQDERAAEVEDSEAALKSLQAENEQLRKASKSPVVVRGEQSGTNQMVPLKNELGRLKEVIDDLETKLEVTDFELGDARSESRTLQGELTTSHESAAKARSELHEVTQKLSQVDEQWRNISSDLENQLITARSQVIRLEHESNAAQADPRSRLEAIKNEHHNAFTRYQNQVDEQRRQDADSLESLRQQNGRLTRDLGSRDDEIRKLNEQLSSMERANHSQQQAPNDAMDVDRVPEDSEEAKRLREQLATTEAQNRALEKKNDDLGKDLQTSKQEAMGVRQTLQQERSAARTEVETANGQQRRLQAQVETLESNLQQSKQTQSELDAVCHDLDRARALLQEIADAGTTMALQNVLGSLITANKALITLRHGLRDSGTDYNEETWEIIKRMLNPAIVASEEIAALERENAMIGNRYPKLLKQAHSVNQRLRQLLDLVTNGDPDPPIRKSQVVKELGSLRGDEEEDTDGPPEQGDDGAPDTNGSQTGEPGPSTTPDSTVAKRPKAPVSQIRKKRRLQTGSTAEPTGQSSAPQAHTGHGTSNFGGFAATGGSLEPGADNDWTGVYDDNIPSFGPVHGPEHNSNSPARPSFADTSGSRPFVFGNPGLAAGQPQPEQRPFTGTSPASPVSDGGGLDPRHEPIPGLNNGDAPHDSPFGNRIAQGDNQNTDRPFNFAAFDALGDDSDDWNDGALGDPDPFNSDTGSFNPDAFGTGHFDPDDFDHGILDFGDGGNNGSVPEGTNAPQTVQQQPPQGDDSDEEL